METLTEQFGEVVQPSPPSINDPLQEVSGPANENRAVAQNRTMRQQQPRRTWVAPGGVIQAVQPFTQTRYNLNAESDVLGNPESMLTQDWKDKHPGWHYAWPIRQSNGTSAFIRAGWFVPIPFDAINGSNPMAAVAEVSTPAGRFVVWKQHLLVGVIPEAWGQTVKAFEQLGIDRAMNQPSVAAGTINSDYAQHGYVYDDRDSGFRDARRER